MAKNREKVYNKLYTEEKWENVNKDNKDLVKDFIDYCKSTDKSLETIKQYTSTLNFVMCYILDFCKNKNFTDLTKRDIIAMQNYFINDCGLSSARISFIKSVMNSLSTYIENILDDEFPDFRPIIRKIPNPNKSAVMEKTVLSQEEMDNLLKQLVAKGLIQEAFYVALLISSGIRKAESLRLDLSWFNDENIIYGCMWKTPQEIKTKGRGLRGKLLTKYFLINKLKPYLELWLQERERLGVNIPDMFVYKKNDTWYPAKIKTLDYWTTKIEKLLGKRFYSHYCRHHYTTSMLEQGLPADVVKDIVGWANVSMIEVYDDRTKEGKFEKYFNENGIVKVEEKKLNEL